MGNINDYKIRPKQVADKSTEESLQRAITLALDVESEAVRHNTQTFNTNRYKAVEKLDDYEALKNRALQIKQHSIQNLPELVGKLINTITMRGGKIFFSQI